MALASKLFEDHAGTIWAGTDGGLFRLNAAQGDQEFHPVELGLTAHADLAVQVCDFVEDDDGSLWIGTKFGLLHRLPEGSCGSLLGAAIESERYGGGAGEDNDGNLWMTHHTGVIVCKIPASAQAQAQRGESLPLPAPVRRYTTADGLGGNQTVALFKSATGRIWVSDTSPALNEFDGRSVHSYSIKPFIEGHNYKTAALELLVSVNTINFHVRSIYEKLQVHSRSEAVAKALLNRLV